MSRHYDIWHVLHDVWSSGEISALATVVATFGSAPRPTGSSMLFTPEGRIVGSVSGGCVEGDVLERARESVRDGTPRQTTYGISDDAFTVGLTCGGTLEVYIEPVDTHTFPELGEVIESVRAGVPVAVVTVLAHRRPQYVGAHVIVHAGGRDNGPCPPDTPPPTVSRTLTRSSCPGR